MGQSKAAHAKAGFESQQSKEPYAPNVNLFIIA